MWSSYLKLSLKVLWRRKFFSFASLFGIGFTLLVVMVVFAMLENLSNPRGPEHQDSTLLHVKFVYLANLERGNQSYSPLGYRLAEKVILPLEQPKAVSLYTPNYESTAFIGEDRATLSLKATDERYFQILNYEFLEGRPYSATEAAEGRELMVINRATAARLFGEGSALGRELWVQGRTFRVIGVVADVSSTLAAGFSESWVPLLSFNQPEALGDLVGNLYALIQPKHDRDIPAIEAELNTALKYVEFPDNTFNHIRLWPESRLQNMARETLGTNGDEAPPVGQFFAILALAVVLFLLLPSINLVNLNLSRILERATEIGLRKAFGASTGVLVLQFVFENTVLTLIGGLFAFLMTPLVFTYLESLNLIPYAHFEVNARVFALALLTMVVFAVFSGGWPAWKMARLLPAAALKGGAA